MGARNYRTIAQLSDYNVNRLVLWITQCVYRGTIWAQFLCAGGRIYVMNEIAIEERNKRLKLCCSVYQPEEAPYVTVNTDSDLTVAVWGRRRLLRLRALWRNRDRRSHPYYPHRIASKWTTAVKAGATVLIALLGCPNSHSQDRWFDQACAVFDLKWIFV
jgi:hypothetical protein